MIEHELDLTLLASEFDHFASKYAKLREIDLECIEREDLIRAKKPFSAEDLRALKKVIGVREDIYEQSADLFMEPFTEALEEDHLETLNSPEILRWIELYELGPYVRFSPSSEEAISLLETIAFKNFDDLKIFIETFGEDLSSEAVGRCWEAFKTLLEVKDVNIVAPFFVEKAYEFAFLFLRLSNAEEVSSSEASIMSLKSDWVFISDQLQKQAQADPVGVAARFGLKAAPQFVRALNPDLYQEQLLAHDIDIAVAELMLPDWRSDFTSFLTAAASLSAD